MSTKNEDHKPFNDVMDHLNKVEGYPVRKAKNLPRPIRWIGYFMAGGIVLIILGMLANLFI